MKVNDCRRSIDDQRLVKRGGILVSPERIAYSGLIGSPTRRVFGAAAIYIAVNSPFELSIDGGPRRRGWLAVIPPNRPHEVATVDRTIRDLLIEPETLADAAGLPIPPEAVADRTAEYRALAGAFEAWLHGEAPVDRSPAAFDRFFFGRVLEVRRLDRRIATIVQRLQAEPFAHITATECARHVNLSVPRFVHLFKDTLDTTFRAYCVWKRARAVLPWMTEPCNLTQLALDAGYADATHFSHSIRRVFGLRPRDILSGSQRLTLHGAPV